MARFVVRPAAVDSLHPSHRQPAGKAAAGEGRRSGPRVRPLAAACRPVAEAVERRVMLAANDPIINEFVASNSSGLTDGDGDFSDWVEVRNPTAAPLNLTGYYLTDSANNKTKWQFPSSPLSTIPANGYLVVFASDKATTYNGFTPQLHTNFKLSADGEYLGLIKPDGTTVASEYAPTYPVQQTDVSYGYADGSTDVPLVGAKAVDKAFVPTTSALPANYTGGYTGGPAFDDSTWVSGTTGVGYGYSVGTNVESLMRNKNATVLVRVPFTSDGGANLGGMRLRLQYDDGFVAYLNGVEIARRNAPATLTGTSSTGGISHDGTVAEEIDVGSRTGLLVNGTNVLAFQGLNSSPTSSDFLLAPQLLGTIPGTPSPTPGFLSTPTPGGPNRVGQLNAGPVIEAVKPSVALPGDADDIVVSAKVTPNGLPAVTGAVLHYRVNFGVEAAVAMADDGLSGDGAAADGVYGATIPAAASFPGQMVRWYVTAGDAAGRSSRAPLGASADAAKYFGTVIANPGVTSPLPIIQIFPESVSNMTAGSRVGTRAAVYYKGEFYDNVFIRDRGGNTSDGIKIDFNADQQFLWRSDGVRVDEVNLNYRSGFDNSNIRAALAFNTFADAGVPGPYAAPWRIQVNGTYWHQATFVEQLDDAFLDRAGLDPNGALYKADADQPTMQSAFYYEKKTRKQEDFSDLQTFLDGIHGFQGETAKNYILDHFDVMGFANYWAVNTVVNDQDDVQKNFFLYRDTEGDGRWRFVPWDKDLTFGKNYGIADYGSRDPQTHPFFGDRNHPKIDGPGAYNYLIDQLLAIPEVKQMYLRRLRSVMDQFLQPTSTPVAGRYFETRLDQYYALLASDPQVLSERGGAATFQAAINDIKNRYLAVRRQHLYVDHSTNTLYPDFAGIPAAQAGSPPVAVGAVDVNPAGGDQNQEYIRLDNPNAAAVDISNWTLADAVDFKFEPGTVIPAGGSLYVARDFKAFLARTAGPAGNQGLFVVGGYRGQLSAAGETIVVKDAGGTVITTYTLPGNPTPAQQGLRVTELNYHPADAAGNTPPDDDFEFIEFQNILSQPLNIAGVKITQGVSFTVGNVTLAAGAYAVVVRNLAAFQARYPGVPASAILGQYTPAVLDNGGEDLRVEDGAGEQVQQFTYDDAWYPSTDGPGYSLVIRNPFSGNLSGWGTAAAWRPSANVGGSPGAADPQPTVAGTTVAGSAWSAAYKAYLGTTGGYAIAPGGPTVLPWTNLNQVTLRVGRAFDPTTVANVTLVGQTTGARTMGTPTLVADAATNTYTATWTLAAPLAADVYHLSAPGLKDAAGDAIAAYNFGFAVVPGDVNASGATTSTDLVAVRNNQGLSTADGAAFPWAMDVNGSGIVSSADLVAVRNNQGVGLPPSPIAGARPVKGVPVGPAKPVSPAKPTAPAKPVVPTVKPVVAVKPVAAKKVATTGAKAVAVTAAPAKPAAAKSAAGDLLGGPLASALARSAAPAAGKPA